MHLLHLLIHTLCLMDSPSPASSSIRRAPRTYGRRRETRDADTSFEEANTSIDASEEGDLSMSTTTCIPPDSDDRDASYASPASNASGASRDDNAEPYSYSYSWRDQMKAIDDPGWEPDIQTDATKSGNTDDLATCSVSSSDFSAAFQGSLPALTNSSQDSVSLSHSERADLLPLSDVDARQTPVSSPHHPISTPKVHSSPTPPTSTEAPPMKGKGKARAYTPLLFDGDDNLPSDPKPSNAKRVSRKRAAKGQEPAKRTKVGGLPCLET